MVRKVIALDIDDVLAANIKGFVAWSNETWGTKLAVDDFSENLAEMWKVSRDVAEERMKNYAASEVVKDYEYFAEAIPVIKHLKQKYDFILVTSRRTVLVPITRLWIDEHFPDLFETIHHTGFFDEGEKHQGFNATKAEICKDIGAQYLIDDQPKHCFAVAEAGIHTLLFGDYAWNRQITNLPPRVTKVKNWREVQEYFDGQPS